MRKQARDLPSVRAIFTWWGKRESTRGAENAHGRTPWLLARFVDEVLADLSDGVRPGRSAGRSSIVLVHLA